MKEKPIITTILVMTLLSLNIFGSYFNVSVASESTIRRVPEDYPTIQEAINAADPGDTILVAAGTYPEHVVVNKSITLKGDNRASIIAGEEAAPRIVDVTVSNVEIAGFTIQSDGTQIGILVDAPSDEIISDVTITDNAIINSYHGVALSFCTRVSITNNSLNGNYYGIRLHDSDHNTITSNTVNGSIYYGINLYARSESNKITVNTLTKNKYCILLEYSCDNTVKLNTIKSNTEYGIRLSYSSGTLVKGNIIMNNKYGVYIWNCSGNTFYYNNFIDNTVQVEHYDVALTANTWDTNVCPGAEGNYWSDYTGVDDGSGVGRWGEGRVADDGIGDTLIPHLAVDWYPLMHPWTPVPSPWPIAIFTYHPPEPIVNLTTTFNASESYDPDGVIVSYDWDFGDTTPIVTETDPITTHIFTETGNFTVTLTVTDDDGLYNSTSKTITVLPYRLMIDVYTQKPEPYSGRGPNQPSDAFAPQENVILYAEVTYNYDPVENKLVAFTVTDPNGEIVVSRSNSTDQFGIATVKFTLSTSPVFGIHTVLAIVEVGDKTANDTLTFKVGWIIEITKVETVDEYGSPKINFVKGEEVYFNLSVKNIAFTTKDVALIVSISDETGQPIGAANLWTQVPPGEYEFALVFSLVIPEWCFVGSASTWACAFTDWPWMGGTAYCPEKLAMFSIMPG